MRPLRFRAFALLCTATLVLAACHDKDKQEAQSGSQTPEAAVQESVALIKSGDFGGFWKHSLPPADYATFRQDWTREDPGRQPLTDEQRAEFTKNYAQWTEQGAETKRFAELQPKLQQLSTQYRDQLPVMVGIFQQIAKTGVEQDKSMTKAQKAQANDVLDVLGPWVQQAPWFDQDKAKQAVAITVDTARKLDLKSADQMRTMDFDTAMQKYAIGFAGLKQVLNLYGLSVDQTLDSVKLSTVENANGHAKIKIDYVLLGKPLSTESEWVQQDGRWYNQDLINNVRETHERLNAPAPAGSAAPQPAPAASSITANTAAPKTSS
ncbi:hypothetical protein [Dyella sp.]|uniref:hypothetical protein n=1 Tax=Dyella sp. TaxID=1869338 RepID=UPI002ED3839E